MRFDALIASLVANYVSKEANGKVEINGSGQATANIDTQSGSLGGMLYVKDTDVSVDSGGTILLGAYDNPFIAIKSLLIDAGTHNVGDVCISTRNAIGDTALTERIRVKYDGKVGINTTSPTYLLDVNGSARLANQISSTLALSASRNIAMTDTGKVLLASASSYGVTLVNTGIDAGFICMLLNNSGSAATITRGASAVMYNTATATDSATISLPARAVATLVNPGGDANWYVTTTA